MILRVASRCEKILIIDHKYEQTFERLILLLIHREECERIVKHGKFTE